MIPPIAAASAVRAFVEPWLPFEPQIKGLPKEFREANGTATGARSGKGGTGGGTGGTGAAATAKRPSGLRGLLRRVTGG